MNKFLRDNWIWIVGVIVALIILYFIYKAIKKSGEKAHQVDINEDVVGSEIPDDDIQVLKALAENLHEDIWCIWCTRDNELYDDLSRLSTNYLVAVSNIYNKLYELKDDETFYQGLNNEFYKLDSYSTATKVETILERLRDEGIS